MGWISNNYAETNEFVMFHIPWVNREYKMYWKTNKRTLVLIDPVGCGHSFGFYTLLIITLDDDVYEPWS